MSAVAQRLFGGLALVIALAVIAACALIVWPEHDQRVRQAVYAARSDIATLKALTKEYVAKTGHRPLDLGEVLAQSKTADKISGQQHVPPTPWRGTYRLKFDAATGAPVVWCAVPPEVADALHTTELSTGTDWQGVLGAFR